MLTSPTSPTLLTSPLDHPQTLLWADRLHKTFTLHNQSGVTLPVLAGVSLVVNAGECVALQGPSGSGKSTFMRALYANYRITSGDIWVRHQNNWVNLPALPPHELMAVRQTTLGYVSQFLRVIPRVPAIAVAAEPLLQLGVEAAVAHDKIAQLFRRLHLPDRLWSLSPTTFSGGEKQRVNIARAFAVDYPVLLLDEPTSALDAANRQVVMELIEERRARGCALVGIFHDDEVRSQVCNRTLTFGDDN